MALDISDSVIQNAQAQADDKCTYLVADMDKYQPLLDESTTVTSKSTCDCKVLLPKREERPLTIAYGRSSMVNGHSSLSGTSFD